MRDDYEPGETEAEHISWLVGHALDGHRGHTEALWRALAADTSDCHDEVRWLRQVAYMVVGQILDRKKMPIQARGRLALDALGLRDQADPQWQLKEDVRFLDVFDDLGDGPVTRSPTQIAKDMRARGHELGKKQTNATKIIQRILDAGQK